MAIARSTPLIEHVLPAPGSRTQALLQDATLIVVGSALMALSARFSIFTPFTPVPFTLQTLVVALLGASLGKWRGSLAMLLYIAEGAAGLPVFSSGGGLAYFFTVPWAGFILAWPFAAFAIGWFCERGLERRYLTSILAMLPGSLITFAVGVTWLSMFGFQGDFAKGLAAGFYPFIIGDLVKEFTAAALLPTAWWIIRKVRGGEPLPHDPTGKE